jgi:hypothetical protein
MYLKQEMDTHFNNKMEIICPLEWLVFISSFESTFV